MLQNHMNAHRPFVDWILQMYQEEAREVAKRCESADVIEVHCILFAHKHFHKDE